MSESHEFNSGTVQEAVSKASKKLGVPESDLKYEVLDDGSQGFLGIGARDARISVKAATTNHNSEDHEKPTAPVDDRDDNPAKEPALPESPESDVETGTQIDEVWSTAPEDLLEATRTFTAEAVSGMGFEARIDVYDTEEFIAVDVSPGDPGLFIGQKGETIDALQHLINIAVYQDRDFVKRIVLDSEGYRQRRIEAVQGMAHRMARRAFREGQEVQLPPMNSSERRIVHTYLKDDSKVNTTSEGSGRNRRVNITPSS